MANQFTPAYYYAKLIVTFLNLLSKLTNAFINLYVGILILIYLYPNWFKEDELPNMFKDNLTVFLIIFCSFLYIAFTKVLVKVLKKVEEAKK